MWFLRQLMRGYAVAYAYPYGIPTIEGRNLVWTTTHFRAVILPSGDVECDGMHGSLLATAMLAQQDNVYEYFDETLVELFCAIF